MKIDLRPSYVQMAPEVLSNLVREVKETLATDIKMPGLKPPTFTAADLWNIRRNAKTAIGRFSR
jgi:dihydroorotase